MTRQEFHALLQRYIAGKSTESEKALVDQWYELLDDADLPVIGNTELDTLEDSLWEKIQDATTAIPVRRISYRKTAVAAAIIALLMVPAVYWFTHRQPAVWYAAIPAAQTMHEQVNNTQQVITITLEDNSKISLYPGSSVRYPLHFDAARREVYLNGQGFFEVHKNPQQPFYVYSHNMTTHVLGTSFMIKPGKEEGLMEVAVRTGRVEVTGRQPDGNNKNGVILTPNQQVVYDERKNRFESSLVEKPEPLPAIPGAVPEKQTMSFEDTPLKQVLAAIGAQYGIEIVEENENLDNCPFTGDISGQSLYNKLDLVCQSVKATYEIKGTRILVRGKGCN